MSIVRIPHNSPAILALTGRYLQLTRRTFCEDIAIPVFLVLDQEQALWDLSLIGRARAECRVF